MRTKEQIEAEIYRIRHYGINSDQTDKSPAEDYADAVAEKRILEELEKELKQLENPLAQIKITEAPVTSLYSDRPYGPFITDVEEKSALAIYRSLEEILQDMIDQKRHLTIMSKLQDTINNGRYICYDPTI